MNKKEFRKERLERHYQALEKLASLCGAKKPNGKKLSLALLKLEIEAHKVAEQACNGEIWNGEEGDTEQERYRESLNERVEKLFSGGLYGFFFNGDPRGHSLKIDIQDVPASFEADYKACGLETDWGGYLLLAPEIN